MSELYDEVMRRQQQDDRQFRLNVANEQQFDPTRSARIFAVSAKTKMPDEVVDADLDNLEGLVKRNEFNADNYTDEANGSPVFNEFAAENPYHLSVLERDRRNMTRLERGWNALSLSWDAGWGMTEIAEIRDRQKKGDIRPEDAENLKGLRELMAGGHFGVENKFAKFFTGFAKQLPVQAWLMKESVDEAALGMATGVAVGGAYGAAGGTFALPGGGTAVGALGGAAGGGLWGIGTGFAAGRTEAAMRLEGGLAYDEFTEIGLDDRKARITSEIIGVVNGLAESFSLGVLTKRLPGFRQVQRDATGEVVSRVFSSPTFKGAVGRVSAAWGEGMATEIVTEIFQESTLMAGREHLKAQARAAGDDRPELDPMKSEEFWKTVEQTAIETMYGTAIIAGMGPASQLYRESRQAYQAERMQQVFKSMGEAAKDTELRTTAPGKYEEFINRLTDFGKTKEFLVDAREFDTYFQEQGIDPDEVIQNLGIEAEAMAEARNLGGAIELPMGAYIKDIAATEHHQGLMPHLKTEGTISISEAKMLEKNNPELVKELESLVSGAENAELGFEQEMLTDVTGQLVAAGHEASTAGTLANIMLGIPNLARRANIDPQELYERVFGGIVPVTDEALQKRDIDVGMDPLLNILRRGKGPSPKAVRGTTLVDFLKKSGGVLDQGGEMSARDAQLEFPGLVSKQGMELDKAAELAAEAGYIAEHDVGLLQEAIDRELSGAEVVGLGKDPKAVEMAALLDALEELLGVAGIDLANMTNEEVRLRLDAMETFFQDENATAETAEIAEILVSEIEQTQDFGDTALTDTLRVQETGKDVKVSQSASTVYNRAVKRRNVVKKLMECVSG